MPLFFAFIGVLLLVCGINNTVSDLVNLTIGKDNGNGRREGGDFPAFVPWFLSIILVGSLGYIRPLRPVANAFLVLVAVMLLLSKSGFFAQFTQTLGLGGDGSVPSGSPGSGGNSNPWDITDMFPSDLFDWWGAIDPREIVQNDTFIPVPIVDFSNG